MSQFEQFKNHQQKNKGGFTLLEVMVAMVITVSSAVLVSNSWSGNQMRIRKSTLLNNAGTLLQRKVVELEGKYQGKKIEEIQPEEGDFGSDYPQYRWKFETQAYVMPDLTSLLSQNNNTSNEMIISMITKLQEISSKVVLEGKVTVFVTVNKKEVSYNVTTYFIEFDSPEIDNGLSL
jgi:prepilin-type N-terminal cleavage/methylation domain-containing protein